MELYKIPAPMMNRAHQQMQFYGVPKQTWFKVYGPPLLLIAASLLVLDGFQMIKGIFEAGFGVGVIVVLASVATLGGIVAMVMRKK
jgi:uncharacterized membrane-anchored protein